MKRSRFRGADHLFFEGGRGEGGGGGDRRSVRRHGVSEAKIYNWKSKYGGL